MLKLCLGITAVLLSSSLMAQSVTDNGLIIPLYTKGIVTPLDVPEIRKPLDRSGDVFILNVSEPALELFLPGAGHANGAAVIIAPGGGFVGLDYEASTAVARALVQHGVTALVLKYRTIRSAPGLTQMPEVHMKEMNTIVSRAKTGVPSELPRFAGEPHAVEDGARAVQIVRERAREWGIDPRRVGFLGFSSGAFLTVDLAIGHKVSRPDFVGVFYGGLRTPVSSDSPPAFIAGAADDEYLPNDPVQIFTAWRNAGAPAELHVYEHGRHGFDLKPRGTTSDKWFDDFILWMKSRSLMIPIREPAK
jgi:acetyl esterase/lipase